MHDLSEQILPSSVIGNAYSSQQTTLQLLNKMDEQSNKHIGHSLEADLLTGWKPKLKVIGPMPLNFDNSLIDKSIMALLHQQSAFYEVVYLGLRPLSTFKMHEHLAKSYRFKYNYLLHNDFAHLKPYYKKFYSLFEPQLKRPFHGMNPNSSKKQLIFDSLFESGNLDCVVRLKSLQYDIILRVDSNTSGHVLWYYFKVHNPENCSKKVKLNIVNLKKTKSAYEKGMRAFVRREGQQWRQQGENVQILVEKLRYHKQNLAILIEETDPHLNDQLFRKLTFTLDIHPKQTLQIAYSVPYTYTQLLEDIKHFKKKSESISGLEIQVDHSHESLSGLEIPILKIHQGQPSGSKYCIFIMARQHPGEANGSYVLKGSLQQLISSDQISANLLKYCDFVVIPMLNPDGVVVGNFRTSLFGKDLNRLFKAKDTTLLPQIEMAREVFTQCSQLYKKKMLLFLDYHGHSSRKNGFVLGPGIFDAQLLNDIRILPKIIATHTDIFRYPSCSFRLDSSKKTTARALFGKLTGLSYTIQASNWSYYSKGKAQVYEFTLQLWQQLGTGIMKGIEQYVNKKVQAKSKYDNKVRQEEKRKLKLVKTKQDLIKSKAITEREKASNFSNINSEGKSKELRACTEGKLISPQQEQIAFEQQRQQGGDVLGSGSESEQCKESESDEQDMQKQKFKRYIKAASEMLMQFEQIYYGQSFRKGNSKYKMNSNPSNKLLLKERKKKTESPVQACLKKIEIVGKEEQQKRQFKKKGEEGSAGKIMKVHSDIKSLDQYRKKGLAPTRKVKIRIGQIKEQSKFTEQLQRLHHLQTSELQKSLQRRKKPQANALRIIKISHPLQNNSKMFKIGLPFINQIKGSPQSIKADKLTQLLITQDKLNRSAVMNVLRLSRNEIDTGDLLQNSHIHRQ